MNKMSFNKRIERNRQRIALKIAGDKEDRRYHILAMTYGSLFFMIIFGTASVLFNHSLIGGCAAGFIVFLSILDW